VIRLTDRARAALRPGEVVLVDWHVTGLCCADTGEFSVRAVQATKLPRRMRSVHDSPPGSVYAHPTGWAHLVDRDVVEDCRRIGRWRHFVTDLPPDAGLRACLGRLPVSPAAPDG
jgi:hypothetical protein